MAIIKPFKGITYNPEKFNKNFSDLISPPYDVIDKKYRQRLLEKHPDNIINIILGLESAIERTPDIYKNAAKTCERWFSEGKLIEGASPAFFVWDQTYKIENKRYTRRALVAKVQARPYKYGDVIPHENTHAKAKADRLELFKACGIQFSQIFSLYRDEDRSIMEIMDIGIQDKIYMATDEEGVENVLYSITDEKSISDLESAFENRSVYIADGHHRYETSVNYFSGLDIDGFTLMTLVALEDPGLKVLPYHRVIRMEESAEDVLKKLQDNAIVELYSLEKWENVYSKFQATRKNNLIGFFNKGLAKCGIIKFKDISFSRSESNSMNWKSLDVSILHGWVLKELFGWTKQDTYSKKKIFFSHDSNECINQTRDEYDWFFFLRPLDIDKMLEVADEGEKMPPKSTFFYPKFLSGFINANLH